MTKEQMHRSLDTEMDISVDDVIMVTHDERLVVNMKTLWGLVDHLDDQNEKTLWSDVKTYYTRIVDGASTNITDDIVKLYRKLEVIKSLHSADVMHSAERNTVCNALFWDVIEFTKIQASVVHELLSASVEPRELSESIVTVLAEKRDPKKEKHAYRALVWWDQDRDTVAPSIREALDQLAGLCPNINLRQALPYLQSCTTKDKVNRDTAIAQETYTSWSSKGETITENERAALETLTTLWWERAKDEVRVAANRLYQAVLVQSSDIIDAWREEYRAQVYLDTLQQNRKAKENTIAEEQWLTFLLADHDRDGKLEGIDNTESYTLRAKKQLQMKDTTLSEQQTEMWIQEQIRFIIGERGCTTDEARGVFIDTFVDLCGADSRLQGYADSFQTVKNARDIQQKKQEFVDLLLSSTAIVQVIRHMILIGPNRVHDAMRKGGIEAYYKQCYTEEQRYDALKQAYITDTVVQLPESKERQRLYADIVTNVGKELKEARAGLLQAYSVWQPNEKLLETYIDAAKANHYVAQLKDKSFSKQFLTDWLDMLVIAQPGSPIDMVWGIAKIPLSELISGKSSIEKILSKVSLQCGVIKSTKKLTDTLIALRLSYNDSTPDTWWFRWLWAGAGIGIGKEKLWAYADVQAYLAKEFSINNKRLVGVTPRSKKYLQFGAYGSVFFSLWGKEMLNLGATAGVQLGYRQDWLEGLTTQERVLAEDVGAILKQVRTLTPDQRTVDAIMLIIATHWTEKKIERSDIERLAQLIMTTLIPVASITNLTAPEYNRLFTEDLPRAITLDRRNTQQEDIPRRYVSKAGVAVTVGKELKSAKLPVSVWGTLGVTTHDRVMTSAPMGHELVQRITKSPGTVSEVWGETIEDKLCVLNETVLQRYTSDETGTIYLDRFIEQETVLTSEKKELSVYKIPFALVEQWLTLSIQEDLFKNSNGFQLPVSDDGTYLYIPTFVPMTVGTVIHGDGGQQHVLDVLMIGDTAVLGSGADLLITPANKDYFTVLGNQQKASAILQEIYEGKLEKTTVSMSLQILQDIIAQLPDDFVDKNVQIDENNYTDYVSCDDTGEICSINLPLKRDVAFVNQKDSWEFFLHEEKADGTWKEKTIGTDKLAYDGTRNMLTVSPGIHLNLLSHTDATTWSKQRYLWFQETALRADGNRPPHGILSIAVIDSADAFTGKDEIETANPVLGEVPDAVVDFYGTDAGVKMLMDQRYKEAFGTPWSQKAYYDAIEHEDFTGALQIFSHHYENVLDPDRPVVPNLTLSLSTNVTTYPKDPTQWIDNDKTVVSRLLKHFEKLSVVDRTKDKHGGLDGAKQTVEDVFDQLTVDAANAYAYNETSTYRFNGKNTLTPSGVLDELATMNGFTWWDGKAYLLYLIDHPDDLFPPLDPNRPDIRSPKGTKKRNIEQAFKALNPNLEWFGRYNWGETDKYDPVYRLLHLLSPVADIMRARRVAENDRIKKEPQYANNPGAYNERVTMRDELITTVYAKGVIITDRGLAPKDDRYAAVAMGETGMILWLSDHKNEWLFIHEKFVGNAEEIASVMFLIDKQGPYRKTHYEWYFSNKYETMKSSIVHELKALRDTYNVDISSYVTNNGEGNINYDNYIDLMINGATFRSVDELTEVTYEKELYRTITPQCDNPKRKDKTKITVTKQKPYIPQIKPGIAIVEKDLAPHVYIKQATELNKADMNTSTKQFTYVYDDPTHQRVEKIQESNEQTTILAGGVKLVKQSDGSWLNPATGETISVVAFGADGSQVANFADAISMDIGWVLYDVAEVITGTDITYSENEVIYTYVDLGAGVSTATRLTQRDPTKPSWNTQLQNANRVMTDDTQ